MTDQFGMRATAPTNSGMTPAAEAHAEVIADAISKGWIVRGIKLGIGFWLAGLIIFVISAVFWLVFIGALVQAYSSAAAVGRDPNSGASGSLPDVSVGEAFISEGDVKVTVVNTGSEAIRSLIIACQVSDAFAGSFEVRSPPGSLPTGDQRLVSIPLDREVSDYAIASCTAT